MAELFKYDLVPSPLFDNDGLISKPQKANLVKELEKKLCSTNYILPDKWEDSETTFIVDVMACLRKLNTKSMQTFGHLCEALVDFVM